MFTFSLNGACNAVVFQDGKKKLHEVRGVWRSYDVKYLQGEDSRSPTHMPTSSLEPQADGMPVGLEKTTLPT